MLDLLGTPPSLNVTSTPVDGGVLLSVRGEIDLASVPILTAELASAEQTGDITIDLSGVTFLGAIGIRTFLRCARDQRTRGRCFEIRNLRPHHRRLLERLGILAELTTALPTERDRSSP